MKSFALKCCSFLLVLSFLISLFGCFSRNERDSEGDSDEENVVERTRIVEVEVEKEKPVYIPEHIEIEYISDGEKEEWREPLERLLEKFQPYGYVVELDPDSEIPEERYEYVVSGSGVALFDLDFDGTPEVLEFYDSMTGSGIPYYLVYDLMSGERIGSLSHNNWQVFFNNRSGEFEAICNSIHNMGAFLFSAQTLKAVKVDNEFLDETLFMIGTEIKADIDFDWNDPEATRPFADFFVNGDECDANSYYADYYEFIDSHYALPQTSVTVFSWNATSSEDEDMSARAKKMTDALLSSSQLFVKGR